MISTRPPAFVPLHISPNVKTTRKYGFYFPGYQMTIRKITTKTAAQRTIQQKSIFGFGFFDSE